MALNWYVCKSKKNCRTYPVLLDNRCYHFGTISCLQHNNASLHYNNVLGGCSYLLKTAIV